MAEPKRKSPSEWLHVFLFILNLDFATPPRSLLLALIDSPRIHVARPSSAPERRRLLVLSLRPTKIERCRSSSVLCPGWRPFVQGMSAAPVCRLLLRGARLGFRSRLCKRGGPCSFFSVSGFPSLSLFSRAFV